jgi:undecaprenyl pyrophosphate phosphatase UppP
MTRRPEKAWEARLKANARRATVRHRNRRVVTGLTLLTVLLAVAGLLAELWLDLNLLAHVCYVAATIAGIVVLVFLFDRRLWITRRPSGHEEQHADPRGQ